jgi:ferredoxin
MSVKKLSQKQLDSWVSAVIQDRKVYGVKAKGDRFAFGPLDSASELRLDYDVTILPPKKYFQPQSEVIARFQKGESYESVVDKEPFVLFGVHPYDLVAIGQMDQVFEVDNPDIHYLARRNAATIVATDVQRPSKNVFASSMNTAHVEEGFDVLVTKVEGGYVVEAKTDKGEALLALAGEVAEATPSDLKLREQVWKHNDNGLAEHKLSCLPTDLPRVLAKSQDNPVWKEKAELCYSCGSCNLVCPTCYCFDVQDDVDWNMQAGERRRSWDGCLLSEFAIVAGDHNFRPKREQRFRHRYYRKGKYLYDKLGQIACVGCGRCVTACTADIANPVEIFNRCLEG